MPSSMPRPARKIGTTSGRGADSFTPTAACERRLNRAGMTRTSRVASYASKSDELFGEPPEGRGIGALHLASTGELVSDEGMVDDA